MDIDANNERFPVFQQQQKKVVKLPRLAILLIFRARRVAFFICLRFFVCFYVSAFFFNSFALGTTRDLMIGSLTLHKKKPIQPKSTWIQNDDNDQSPSKPNNYVVNFNEINEQKRTKSDTTR